MELFKNKKIKNTIAVIYMALISSILTLLSFSCMEDRAPTAPIEITRPELIEIQPAQGELIFPAMGSIKIIFDEKMNPETFLNHFILKDYFGNLAEVVLTQQDTIINFTPKMPLQKSTIYYAELRGRIRDANNNSIGIGGEPILDDTTLLSSTWFYTEGDYSQGGFYPIFLRDKKEGAVRIFNYLDSVVTTSSGFTAPEGMASSEDDQFIILSNTAKNEVHIIDAVTGNSVANLTVPATPSSVVVYGEFAYVICINGKSLCKINIPAKTLQATYPLTIFPGKLAVSTDGSILYTFDQVTRDLYLLNSSDGSTIKKLNAAVDRLISGEIIVDKFTGELFICDSKGFKIKKADKDGNTINTIVTFPNNIEPVEVAFNESFYYAASGNAVYKYDRNNNNGIDTVNFTTKLKSLSLIPSGELLYVSLATSIAIVDVKTLTILEEKDLASSGIETIISATNKR
jgi:DNA-binding beta-propeller fold protein YncE